MELYQETRRYNSTSSWSPSCNRRVVAADEREREREKKNERNREKEKEIIVLLLCILRISSSSSSSSFLLYLVVSFLPGCDESALVVALSSLRNNFDVVSDFVIFLSGGLYPKEITTLYHAYFLNLKDSRGRFGVRRRREGVHAGHGRVVWRQNVAHRGEEAQ